MTAYRARLAEVASNLGKRPSRDALWASPDSHEWLIIEHHEQRFAVHDRDVEEIIRTHARDQKQPAWLQDTAEALAEIGEFDLAIDWAQRATEHPGAGHQAATAGEYWCSLLAEHRPRELAAARLTVFKRWPSASTAGRLHRDVGPDWSAHRDEVMQTLAARPRDAVLFAMNTLNDVPLAWQLAHDLGLDDDHTWSELAEQYEPFDRLATLPIHARLVDQQLVTADANNYRLAARRLARMRRLAYGSDRASEVDELVGELRQAHKHRPRLQTEFTRAGLP